ncbi:MAG: sialate O-acetylesterase [Planctomycetota bacterium]|nr:sialate O-acetylesterase [Planctomycetota bacterium]
MASLSSSLLQALACAALVNAAAAQRGPVKVIVLAGQSNMEGKAQNKLWEHQATDGATRDFFAPFREGENTRWVTRDDVWIKFFGRKGPLTLGYGSRGRTGLEYAFGLRVGDHFDEPVLLIKTAWGGRSIRKDFRPPSSGLPADAVLEKELADAIKRTENNNKKRGREDQPPTRGQIEAGYGRDYRLMLDEIRETMRQPGVVAEQLKGRDLKLAGFVWFQGWNDQYGGAETEYEQNLRNFIRDVRRDLDAPRLPFVIGVMGQNGAQPAKGAMLAIQQAQAAVGDMPGVAAVRTDALEDAAAAKLYPEWKQRFEEWERTGSDHRYHYLGSAIWFSRIGFALGDALIRLGDKR